MAKRKTKKKQEETYPTLEQRGRVTTQHPQWGSGGPILVGDTCKHAEYGKCVVRSVDGSSVNILDGKGVNRRAHVAEVWHEVTQVPHLANVKSWEALTSR